jgi:hypothetical protein
MGFLPFLKFCHWANMPKVLLHNVMIVQVCRVSTDWISYNYLKAQHLIAGCKTEIIELLASDQE